MKSFADQPEMRIIDTKNLRELSGILQLDLFAQCLSQARSQTSMESDPQVYPTGDSRLVDNFAHRRSTPSRRGKYFVRGTLKYHCTLIAYHRLHRVGNFHHRPEHRQTSTGDQRFLRCMSSSADQRSSESSAV